MNETKGKEAWSVFSQTGSPEAYLRYRRIKAAEDERGR